MCSLRGQDFQRILAEEFGVQRSLAAVYDLLHSLGYSYVRPRPIHRKSEPVAREQFKQDWPETLQSIAALHPGKPHYIPASRTTFLQTVASLLSGRITFGPARDYDQCVGQERVTPHGYPADRVGISVGDRCGQSDKPDTPKV